MMIRVQTAFAATLTPFVLIACASSGRSPAVAVDSTDAPAYSDGEENFASGDPTSTDAATDPNSGLGSAEAELGLDAGPDAGPNMGPDTETGAPQVENDAPVLYAPTLSVARTEEEEIARVQAIRRSLKRYSTDLLKVAFTPLQGATELTLESGDQLVDAYREAFHGHTTFRPVDDVRVADAHAYAVATDTTIEVPTDVLITTSAETTDSEVTLRATVASAYGEEAFMVELSDASLDTLLPRFVEEVERITLELIGPTIPENADHLRRDEHLETAGKRALLRSRDQS